MTAFPTLRLAGAAGLLLAATLPAMAATTYPLTLENCGVQLRFEHAPDSAVTIGQSATETMYALGLGDKVKGTSVWFTDVLPQYRALNDGIERMADNDPSFESVVAKKPGLVAAQYEWHVGPQGLVGTREQFADLGIPTYIMAADCAGKDNSKGSDGTRAAMFSMDGVYQGVQDLARIFDHPEAGEELVAKLRQREQAAIDKAGALGVRDVPALFWFSSADLQGDPYVAGRKGPPGYMMAALGLRNVIESDEEWPTVGWETIARANPAIIVVAKMSRRRFDADDVDKKLEFLKTDPVASQIDAVRNNRIVVLDAHSMDPSIRNITAIEELAQALDGFDLK